MNTLSAEDPVSKNKQFVNDAEPIRGGYNSQPYLPRVFTSLFHRPNTGRTGNDVVRSHALRAAQGIYGNRALQRTIRAHAALHQPPVPVQRSPLYGSSGLEDELLTSATGGGVCLPEDEENVSWGTGLTGDAPALEGFSGMFQSSPSGPPFIQPEPNAPDTFDMQKQMQNLKRMYEIMSNVSKTRSEISMTFARNARA